MRHGVSILRFFVALLGGGCALLAGAPGAQASPDYPVALQQALDHEYPAVKHCAPLCTACHNTTQGGPGNINPFGATLEHFGLSERNAALVPIAIHALATASPPPDTDGDNVSDVDELNAGDSPSLAGPAGTGQFCPDIAYGCGAHIAATPARDRWSLVPAALVTLGLILARRRRSSARAGG